MKVISLIVLMSATAWSVPIIVDDPDYISTVNKPFTQLLSNLIAREMALSGAYETVYRPHNVKLEKESEFDVPGLIFTREFQSIRPLPLILLLNVREWTPAKPHLRVSAKLFRHQEIRTANLISQQMDFDLKDKDALKVIRSMAKAITLWTIKKKGLILGTIEIR